MKVRVGVGLGATAPADPEPFADVVVAMEACGFDSLWLSEVLTAPALDPLTALAWAGARTTRLKLGTTMVLPGRNPVRLAKELATLDRLTGGRLLLVFVLGLRQQPELGALGVEADRRGAEVDEVLPLLRRLWDGEVVDHEGPRWSFSGVGLAPRPRQAPLEPWLGGLAPAALRRCGRLADGWLPAQCTPAEAAAGRRVVEEAAAGAGRAVDPEHFGVSVGYAHRAVPAATVRALAARRPGLDPAEVVPVGLPALRRHLERFVDVGFSKFVVRPLDAPASWPGELEALAGAVLDLQR